MGKDGAGEGVVIKWLGHACFHLKFEKRSGPVDVITDPYRKGMGYRDISVRADVVTISHRHSDHDQLDGIQGDPVVLYGITEDGDWAPIEETIQGVEFKSIGTYHDPDEGSRRGKNACFIIRGSGLTLVHLGDLGSTPPPDVLDQMKAPDVLFIPVGGYFTIGPREAAELAGRLEPRICVPMHYRTAAIRDWPIGRIEPFLESMPRVVRDVSLSMLEPDDLPSEQETWVLDYAE